jgi:uncharacterized protein DUF4333
MTRPHDQRPEPSHERRTARRWAGHATLAGMLVAGGLAVTACGSSSTATTILNTEKVESAIQQSILAQRSHHARVTCPSGVHQKKGLVFACTAVVKTASTRFVVTQLDGAGHVHYVAR